MFSEGEPNYEKIRESIPPLNGVKFPYIPSTGTKDNNAVHDKSAAAGGKAPNFARCRLVYITQFPIESFLGYDNWVRFLASFLRTSARALGAGLEINLVKTWFPT